ncbi:hypothetical protein O181_117113 [Austropuccinia psidii MF-1]|uniref:Uncharacterized protein n=1 Tax=Austropuccinia psidii MF-1 TaxID=1389203 RepID=A0A9Q3PX67_9BASI|nr:hypothetical protein [Austropuccinia psidii MF-1]
MSHQTINTPQNPTITSQLVHFKKNEKLLPNNPSSLANQYSPTPTHSLASYFENTPQIFKKSPVTFTQIKNIPTGAPQQEYTNHPSLPNFYVINENGAPFQA